MQLWKMQQENTMHHTILFWKAMKNMKMFPKIEFLIGISLTLPEALKEVWA